MTCPSWDQNEGPSSRVYRLFTSLNINLPLQNIEGFVLSFVDVLWRSFAGHNNLQQRVGASCLISVSLAGDLMPRYPHSPSLAWLTRDGFGIK